MANSTSSGSGDYGLFDELAEEFAERYRRGQRPSLREYIDRYPETGDAIRELFPALVEVDQAEEVLEGSAGRTALPPTSLGSDRVSSLFPVHGSQPAITMGSDFKVCNTSSSAGGTVRRRGRVMECAGCGGLLVGRLQFQGHGRALGQPRRGSGATILNSDHRGGWGSADTVLYPNYWRG
jgi:hypothetical protein